MQLEQAMAALAGGKAKVVDVTSLKAGGRSGDRTANDVDIERQVALG